MKCEDGGPIILTLHISHNMSFYGIDEFDSTFVGHDDRYLFGMRNRVCEDYISLCLASKLH